MFPELIIPVVIAAFILEFFDASAGMGYGEITALLLLLGFAPLQSVFAVILSSAVLGLVASFFHQNFKNIDFGFEKKEFKITLVLTAFGVLGILIGALIALNLPEFFLKAYIGLLVIIIGLTILIKRHKKHPFSWKRIISQSISSLLILSYVFKTYIRLIIYIFNEKCSNYKRMWPNLYPC